MAKNHRGDLHIQRNLRVGSVSNSQKANIVSNSGSIVWSTDNARLEVSDGSVFSPLGGAAVAELVNSSGTPYVNSLSGATGSGEVKFFVNQDISDTATLTVPSGQSLNGVVDGTFLFSNYDNNTQFRVDDVAPSGWAVSVVGAPTESVRPYGYAELTVQNIVSELGLSLDDAQLNYTMSVDNDASPGSPVPFFAGRADGMTFIPATAATFPDGFSLNIGSTVESSFRIEQDGNYTVQYKMPNPENSTIDDGGLVPLAVLIDTDGTTILSAKASPSEDSADSAFCQFDFEGVQAGQYIQVGVTTTNQDNSGGDTIDISVPIDADDPQAADIDSMVHANVTIFKNNTTETVLAGMVTPTPLSYFSVDLLADQTIGNADIDIVFDNVDFDPDSGFNTGTGEYTIPAGKGGLWMFGGTLSFKNNGTAGDDPRTVDLMVNGVVSDSIRINPEAVSSTEAQPVTISSLRQVSEGDVIKLRVSSGANTVALDETSGFWGKEQVTSSVADPGSVPVEDLHYVSIYTTDETGVTSVVATTVGAGYEVGNLADTDLTILDPFSLVDTANNTITITNDGRYEIIASARTGSNAIFAGPTLFLNGAQLASSFGQDGGSQASAATVNVVLDLVAGDVIEVGTPNTTNSSLRSPSVTVKQLSAKTITVVPSGVIEARTLHRATYGVNGTGAAANTAAATVLPLSDANIVTHYDTQSLRSGDTVVIKQAGNYRIVFSGGTVSVSTYIRINGTRVASGFGGSATADSGRIEYIADLAVGDVIDVDADASTVWYRPSLTVAQLPTEEYVTPGDVLVEDLASFHVVKNANQGVNNNLYPAGELVTWETTLVDNQLGMSGNAYVAPSDGDYLIEASVEISTGDTPAGGSWIWLEVDGTEQARNLLFNLDGGMTESPMGTIKTVLSLTAGQAVEAYVTVRNGSTDDILSTPQTTYFKGRQLAKKTITVAPSGVLQAENLTASRFSLSADSGSVVVCPFDTTDYNEDTSRYALQGGGGVLVQPGRYLVTVKPSRQGALLDWELWNNTAGSQVMQGRMDHAGGIDNTDQSTTYLTLSSASEIQLRELDGDASVVWNGNSDLYGCTMEFVQLPETQYVNPSGVPVEDVEVTLFSGSATDGANVLDGGVTWDDVVANYEYVKVSNISANFVRSAAEVYTADLTLGTTIIGWSVGNGASASVTTTSGSGAFTLTGGTGTLRITGVRAQKTVINTTDTPTDDQAASGYFDVGTMRIQWGQFTTGSNVVTAFPAPFADTSYSIVANTQSTGDDPHTVSFYNKTTTQVESDGWKADDRTPATFTAGFIAIGLKP